VAATSRDRRRELRDSYERSPRRAGVYAIRNRDTGRMLIASTTDLESARNRFEFGLSTGSVGALDQRLAPEARRLGVTAFEFTVLDKLPIEPDADQKGVEDDLGQLEELWRAKLADTPQY
jgi:hypothetical protein